MKEIFIVSLDWACDDNKGLDIYAFTTYQAAYEKFNDLIKDECNPDNSWVGDLAFDENGILSSKSSFASLVVAITLISILKPILFVKINI